MIRIAASLLALTSLAGCDNEPNPNFQKSVEDRAAAQAGDPYDQLSKPPRFYYYSNAQPAQKATYPTTFGGSFGITYETMLATLDSDKEVDRKLPIYATCRPHFTAVRAYQADPVSGEEATAKGAELYGLLNGCREQALEIEKNGDKDAPTAILIRRFASAGMALAGMAVVAKGDKTNGAKLWSEGDALVMKDRPGFKLKVESLRGY